LRRSTTRRGTLMSQIHVISLAHALDEANRLIAAY
jgi:hypothetical protein